MAAYDFDALGRRVAKHLGNSSPVHEFYYYDGNRILESYQGTSAAPPLYRQYVYGQNYIDELVAYYDADGSHTSVLQDAGYDVVGLVDADGNLIQHYSLDPYGQWLAAENVSSRVPSPISVPAVNQQVLLRRGHNGLPYDVETGLYHARLRDLAAYLGRMMQRDPYQTALILANALRSNAQTANIFVNLRAGGQYTDGMSLYLNFSRFEAVR